MTRYLESSLMTLDADEEGRPERGTIAGARAHLADIRRCIDEIMCIAACNGDDPDTRHRLHMVALNRLYDLEGDTEDHGERKATEPADGHLVLSPTKVQDIRNGLRHARGQVEYMIKVHRHDNEADDRDDLARILGELLDVESHLGAAE